MASPPPTEPALRTEPPLRERLFPNGEWVLLLVLALECGVFASTGRNFPTAANALEVTRLAVEVGLLALALTPIIITGGIDLSVGSMIGPVRGRARCPLARPGRAHAHSRRDHARGGPARRAR